MPFEYEQPLEWRLAGTREMSVAILQRVAFELGFSLHQRDQGAGLNAWVLHTPQGAIGKFYMESIPGGRTRLLIPVFRGATSNDAWPRDKDGKSFGTFLERGLFELAELGFLAGSSRFKSYEALVSGRKAVDVAEDGNGFAAAATVLRASVIALANELFEAHMLPEGADPPKGDDAKSKLAYVVKFYLAGRGERYVDALVDIVEKKWALVSAAVHRKNMERSDAAIVLVEVEALFESFSRLAP